MLYGVSLLVVTILVGNVLIAEAARDLALENRHLFVLAQELLEFYRVLEDFLYLGHFVWGVRPWSRRRILLLNLLAKLWCASRYSESNTFLGLRLLI